MSFFFIIVHLQLVLLPLFVLCPDSLRPHPCITPSVYILPCVPPFLWETVLWFPFNIFYSVLLEFFCLELRFCSSIFASVFVFPVSFIDEWCFCCFWIFALVHLFACLNLYDPLFALKIGTLGFNMWLLQLPWQKDIKICWVMPGDDTTTKSKAI